MRHTVSLDDFNNFEEDDSGQLFWKGNRIIVEQRLVPPTWVNVAFVIAAAGAALSGIMAFVSYVWP